jgi:colanic acid/amylovoran biosynthesis glycosyltransferase
MNKLILFTNSYPYGIGELWKHNELKLLSSQFDVILVIPLTFGGNVNPKDIPLDNVEVLKPIIQLKQIKLNHFDLLIFLLSKFSVTIIKELICLKIKNAKKNLIKLLNSAKRARLIIENKKIKEIIDTDNSQTILYFYWGLGASEILPFIDESQFKKVVVRMHRYDLYEYENGDYIPFRKQLLNKKIVVLPSSYDGYCHLKGLYPNTKAEIKTQRCGVIRSNGVTTGGSSEKLKVVSCSLLVPVKRIDRMIKEASLLNIPFEWIHIGFGELEQELNELIIQLNLEHKFNLIGQIDSELILDYYLQNNFDIFINTSKSEGVPFSIMEAFSVGIPVIATDAGGTKEIVDAEVGELLKNDFQQGELKDAIERYFYLSKTEKSIMRKSTITRFEQKCDMEKLTVDFLDVLMK